jgi:hypothetical protein
VAFSETTRIPYPKLYKKLNSNLNMWLTTSWLLGIPFLQSFIV